MDEHHFELAAALEEMTREAAIAAARTAEQRAHHQPEGFGGLCQQCGTEIPAARVASRYFTCVDCVREQELRTRLRI